MRNAIFTAGLLAIGLAATANAAVFTGNGDSGFGGAIGNGSLTLTNDGTTISGSFTKGGGTFNDVLVLYVDSVAGGLSDTSTLADGNDGLRKAISGFDAGTPTAQRSVLTLPTGFTADYAIALAPSAESFGGVFQLVAGGNNSLVYQTTANLTPLTNSATTYTFSVPVSALGLTANSGATIKLLGTYISNTGYRSTEAIAGNTSGTQGYNAFTSTGVSYSIVPEPASLSLLGLGAVAMLRRRK